MLKAPHGLSFCGGTGSNAQMLKVPCWLMLLGAHTRMNTVEPPASPLSNKEGGALALQATNAQLTKGELQAGAVYTAMPRLDALISEVFTARLPEAGTTALNHTSRLA